MSSVIELAKPSTTSAGLSLRWCVQWSLLGSVVYAACQWAILIVLAKLSSIEAVGQFALGLAVTAPVMLFANLQLSALQATDAKRDYRFGHYLALRLITTAVALIVIAGLSFGVGYSPITAWVVFAVGAAKAFESISDIYHGLMQQQQRMERIARSMILRGTLSLFTVAGWLCLGGDILGAAGAMALTWGILLIGYDVRSVTWLRSVAGDDVVDGAPIWDWSVLGQLAWQAFPVGLRTVLFVLCANIPRYFLEQYQGEEAVGIFAALTYVTVVGQVLSNAVAQAAAPRLAKYHADGDLGAFRMLVLKMTGAGALVGALGVVAALLVGAPLLTLFYRPEYAEHVGIFAWIMAGAGMWCAGTMLVMAANAAGRHRSQAVAGIVTTAATIVVSAWLIGAHGLAGAAAASVISAAIGLAAFGGIFLTIGPARKRGDA